MIARYFLCWATVSFILGILAGNYWYPAFELSAGLAAAALALARVFHRTRIFPVFIFVALLFLGAAYEKSFYVAQRGTLPRYYAFKPKVTAIEGVVVSEVSERRGGFSPKRNFTLAVRRVRMKGYWKEYEGRILVNLFRRDREIQYGDVLCLTGKLHRPFFNAGRGRSSYREYLQRQGIYWVFSVSKKADIEVLAHGQGNRGFARLLLFRERLRQVLRRYLNPTEAAIMETMLLGATNDAPRYIQDLFRNTGTTHILAISGLHVAVMAVLFFVLLKVLPIGRKAQYLLTILLLLGYTLLTGCRPSAVRAFLMASVFLASFLVERENESLNSLALSAFLILLLNPFYLFDIGFQLSFVCVMGILLVFPILWQLFESRLSIQNQFLRGQAEALTLSLAVWFAVGGFILYYFWMISPVTVLANLVVVPLSSLVLFLGTGLLLSGLFLPFLAMMFAICLELALSVMVYCVYLFSKIPFGWFRVNEIPLFPVVIYYVLLALGCWMLGKKVPRPRFSPEKNPWLG